MYDDIEYSKDDFVIRSIQGMEYAVCMTTLRIVKTIFVNVAFINKNERQMYRHSRSKKRIFLIALIANKKICSKILSRVY